MQVAKCSKNTTCVLLQHYKHNAYVLPHGKSSGQNYYYHISTFYCCGPYPSRVAHIVEAHAMCPTLEFEYPCATFLAYD